MNIDGVEYVTEERLVKHVKYNDNLQAKVKRLETSCRSWSHQHAEQGREINALTAEVERLNYLVVNIGKRFDKEREHVKTLQKRLGRDNYGTQPAKPVVWVRESHGGYKFCTDDSGDKLCVLEMCGNMTPNFKAPFDAQFWLEAVAGIVAEVRVWPETCDKCGQAIESEGR